MHIRPVDMPELRSEAQNWVSTKSAAQYERALRGGYQHHRPGIADPAESGRVMARMETQRLRLAELFHVSGPMMELARAAERSLVDFNLLPEDLPAPAGFVYFESPMDVFAPPDRGGTTTSIVAASWGPVWQSKQVTWPEGGLWITWYSDAGHMYDQAEELGMGRASDVSAARRAHLSVGRLLIDNESAIPFSHDPLAVIGEAGQAITYREAANTTIDQWTGVLKTIWLLMGQTLASVQDARFDRASSRRETRAGRPQQQVRCITLRRPAGSDDGSSEREYVHRWIVRGHWRQQWYPSRGVNRPVWIAPHIKGPEGAPLLGGEKVYALRR